MAPSNRNNWYWARVGILVAIPLLMIAIAGALGHSGWSSSLFYAGVIALAVMLVESFLELHKYREFEDHSSELQALRVRLDQQAVEIQAGAADRRLASLLRFVGETAPTVAELSLREPQILDGWFGLISSRVQKETATGYAQVVLLREGVIWAEGEFVNHYEVAFGGGSDEFGLDKESRLPASDIPASVLVERTGAGSAYVSEFSLGDEPYWLCVLLSTNARHDYLETLARAIVAVVLVTLTGLPPASQRTRLGKSRDTGL